MQFTAPAARLSAALELLTPALPTSGKLPASLSMVRIDADAAGRVGLSVNVLDRTVATQIDAHVTAGGAAAVPGAQLAKLAAAFPAKAELELAASAKGLHVRTGRARHALPVRALADLPEMPSIDQPTGSIELAGDVALAMLETPSFAASEEQSRLYLCCICLHNDGAQLHSIATDGITLVRVSTPAPSILSDDLACLIPLASAKLIIKLLKKTKPVTVQLRRSQRLLEITTPALTFTTKLIAGTFPDYRRLIPTAAKRSIAVNRAALLAGLDRLEATHKLEPALAGLRLGANLLELTLLREPDAAHDEIAAVCTGQGDIALALRPLHQLVSELSAVELTIEQAEEAAPLRIAAHDEGLLVLLAPARWPIEQHEQRRAAAAQPATQ